MAYVDPAGYVWKKGHIVGRASPSKAGQEVSEGEYRPAHGYEEAKNIVVTDEAPAGTKVKVYIGETSTGQPIEREVYAEDLATMTKEEIRERYGSAVAESVQVQREQTPEGEMVRITYPIAEQVQQPPQPQQEPIIKKPSATDLLAQKMTEAVLFQPTREDRIREWLRAEPLQEQRALQSGALGGWGEREILAVELWRQRARQSNIVPDWIEQKYLQAVYGDLPPSTSTEIDFLRGAKNIAIDTAALVASAPGAIAFLAKHPEVIPEIPPTVAGVLWESKGDIFGGVRSNPMYALGYGLGAIFGPKAGGKIGKVTFGEGRLKAFASEQTGALGGRQRLMQRQNVEVIDLRPILTKEGWVEYKITPQGEVVKVLRPVVKVEQKQAEAITFEPSYMQTDFSALASPTSKAQYQKAMAKARLKVEQMMKQVQLQKQKQAALQKTKQVAIQEAKLKTEQVALTRLQALTKQVTVPALLLRQEAIQKQVALQGLKAVQIQQLIALQGLKTLQMQKQIQRQKVIQLQVPKLGYIQRAAEKQIQITIPRVERDWVRIKVSPPRTPPGRPPRIPKLPFGGGKKGIPQLFGGRRGRRRWLRVWSLKKLWG